MPTMSEEIITRKEHHTELLSRMRLVMQYQISILSTGNKLQNSFMKAHIAVILHVNKAMNG